MIAHWYKIHISNDLRLLSLLFQNNFTHKEKDITDLLFSRDS